MSGNDNKSVFEISKEPMLGQEWDRFFEEEVCVDHYHSALKTPNFEKLGLISSTEIEGSFCSFCARSNKEKQYAFFSGSGKEHAIICSPCAELFLECVYIQDKQKLSKTKDLKTTGKVVYTDAKVDGMMEACSLLDAYSDDLINILGEKNKQIIEQILDLVNEQIRKEAWIRLRKAWNLNSKKMEDV